MSLCDMKHAAESGYSVVLIHTRSTTRKAVQVCGTVTTAARIIRTMPITVVIERATLKGCVPCLIQENHSYANSASAFLLRQHTIDGFLHVAML